MPKKLPWYTKKKLKAWRKKQEAKAGPSYKEEEKQRAKESAAINRVLGGCDG